jgi:hypothetical protein
MNVFCDKIEKFPLVNRHMIGRQSWFADREFPGDLLLEFVTLASTLGYSFYPKRYQFKIRGNILIIGNAKQHASPQRARHVVFPWWLDSGFQV